MISTEIIPAKIEPIPGVPVRQPHTASTEQPKMAQKQPEIAHANGAVARLLDPRNMWLPVTVYVSITVVLLVGAWEVRGWKQALDHNTNAITELRSTIRDNVARKEFADWVRMLRVLNPEIRFPDEGR